MYWAVLIALALSTCRVCLAGQPIGILFDFTNQPEPSLIDLMKSEIRDILAPADLELSFQRVGDAEASQPFRKIIVIRFTGACHTQADSKTISLIQPTLFDLPALAKTDVVGGRIVPYVHVYCNEVRAFVPSVSSNSFTQMYGRALGRVVVHELYHVLLSTRNHSRTGVARFAQSARDLTRDKLTLDLQSIYLLRALYGAKENEGGSEEPPSRVKGDIQRVSRLEHQPQR